MEKLNEFEIVYQAVKIPEEEAEKVFQLVEANQPFLENKKNELHVTFAFYGYKNLKRFGDEGIFPFDWVKEKKKVRFIVSKIGNDGEAQGVFLSFHEDTEEDVKCLYQNKNPLHLTISLNGNTPPVKTGLINESFKEDIYLEDGNYLIITGFIDVFVKKKGFLSEDSTC